MFRRILIANRGEIARRIARTAERLGIAFVAVYSDADADAPHLQGAVATVRIGPAPAALSYLSIPAIVEAAVKTGCDAVHPGYGFLSENAAFARAVEAAGLVFIGPCADTIAAMGDKSAAKEIMRQAGVPVVPGTARASDDPEEIESLVAAMEFPAILKPVAGGGGKGMMIVAALAEVRDTAAAAIRLSRASFGDGRLLVERYVQDPRHIEVQIFGDNRGNVVHLYERECSLQRRHQKIIEEAPAANLPAQLRAELLDAAVRGATAMSYQNAGTFEFILDRAERFYFLEVNTRLQVEHPVTELITGYDLVEWQIRIAAGEPLPASQAEITATGHAVECRVYAEDPADDFRPAPGRVSRVIWPDGIRIDSAVADGSVVTPFYDPMIAKVIGAGANRGQALRNVAGALEQMAIFGVTTNIPLLIDLLRAPSVLAGRTHTGTVEGVRADWTPVERADAVCAIGAAALLETFGPETEDPRSDQICSPWRNGRPLDRVALDRDAPLGRISFWLADRCCTVRIIARAGNILTIAVDGASGAEAEPLIVVVERRSATLAAGRLGGRRWTAVRKVDAVEVIFGGAEFKLARLSPANAGDGDESTANAVAPMPGTVVAIMVAVGDTVAAGDALVVIEAMKLESTITAPRSGVVAELHCRVGEMIASRQTLVVVSPPQALDTNDSVTHKAD